MMDPVVTILIADRNPNVRDFLKREMVAEKYRVIVAEDAKTLLRLAFETDPVDILIIDPDLPDMEPCDIIKKINNRVPPLPMVIHALPENDRNGSLVNAGVLIEKESRSIEVIKKLIRKMIAERTA